MWEGCEMVELHRAEPDDWSEWRSARLDALTGSPRAFTTVISDWEGQGDTERRWRDRLTSVPFNRLARRGAETVGMVSAVTDAGDGSVELLSLWVAPGSRGAGVGDALVDAVIGWARGQSARSMVLRVIEGNDPAERLYRRHGLVPSGRTVAGPAGSEIEMRRRL